MSLENEFNLTRDFYIFNPILIQKPHFLYVFFLHSLPHTEPHAHASYGWHISPQRGEEEKFKVHKNNFLFNVSLTSYCSNPPTTSQKNLLERSFVAFFCESSSSQQWTMKEEKLSESWQSNVTFLLLFLYWLVCTAAATLRLEYMQKWRQLYQFIRAWKLLQKVEVFQWRKKWEIFLTQHISFDSACLPCSGFTSYRNEKNVYDMKLSVYVCKPGKIPWFTFFHDFLRLLSQIFFSFSFSVLSLKSLFCTNLMSKKNFFVE